MKLATTLNDIQAASSTCLRCSWCAYGPWPENHPLCPIYWHYPSFTFRGGGFLFLALALLENKIDFNQSIADYAFSCASCLACDTKCTLIRSHKSHLHILDAIRLLRSEGVKRGFIPEGAAKKIYDEVKNTGDYGQVSSLKLPDKIISDKADTVIFAECSHAKSQGQISEAVVKLLGYGHQGQGFVVPEGGYHGETRQTARGVPMSRNKKKTTKRVRPILSIGFSFEAQLLR